MADRSISANQKIGGILPFPAGHRGHIKVVNITDKERMTSWEHKKRRRRRLRINAWGMPRSAIIGRA